MRQMENRGLIGLDDSDHLENMDYTISDTSTVLRDVIIFHLLVY